MQTLRILAAATFAALSLSAYAGSGHGSGCPAGAMAGTADCPMGKHGGGHRGAKMQERLKAADTNGDGFISRDEATALPRIAEHFDAIDANKDGQVATDELRAYHHANRGKHRAEMWKKLDANADGKLSKEEVTNHPRLLGRFDAIDANKDGLLTPEELEAARVRHAGHGTPRS